MEKDYENSRAHKEFSKASKELQKLPKLIYRSSIGRLLRSLGIVSEKKLIKRDINKLGDSLHILEEKIGKYEDIKENVAEYGANAEKLMEKYDDIVKYLGHEAEQLKNRYRAIKEVQITNTSVPVLKEECYHIRKEFRGIRLDLRAFESKMEKIVSFIDYNSNVKEPLVDNMLNLLKDKYTEIGKLKAFYETLNTTRKAS